MVLCKNFMLSFLSICSPPSFLKKRKKFSLFLIIRLIETIYTLKLFILCC